MNATTVVAIAGLITTTLSAIVVPAIQGRIAARVSVAGREHERQLADNASIREQLMAVYVEASAYVTAVELRINDLTTPIEFRRSGKLSPLPETDNITARLRLLGNWQLFHHWQKLLSAAESLWFDLGEEGPQDDHGSYYTSPDDPGVGRVLAELKTVTSDLRSAVGVEPPSEPGH
ncbi:hypothetical protein [Dactylosporangium sp. CS-033363]|uniref:hypothetical protein n=1 Tax=Dactylosporangium sp. CS-033363 TaxID=3239935 RepID=UPI003D89EF3E